jgi:hypothetical protein
MAKLKKEGIIANKTLPREIGEFYDALLEKVRTIRVQAQERMTEIKKEQRQLAENLQGKLAKGESLRKRDFNHMLASLVETRKNREQEVMELLARFQKEEEEMAAGLKQLLGDGKRVRIKDLKKFLSEFKRKGEERGEDIFQVRKEADSIKNQAQLLIEEFRKEREEMAKQWRELALAMQKKRGKG